MVIGKSCFRVSSRSKRKYTSVHKQDALLETFYQDLDQQDEDFLGNRFIGEDEDNTYPEGSNNDGGNN